MARSHAIRFTFEISSGDGPGLSVGQFRIWCHGDDTYIADAGVPQWKTSLHGDVAWRTAETKESHTSPAPLLAPHTDRAPWKYTPPPFVAGHRLAFVIATTRGALGPWPTPERYERVEVRDRWDELTKVEVWMTSPGVAIPADQSVLGTTLHLANGTQVWARVSREPIDPIAPEPVPASAVLAPQVPERDGVSAPGVILRGAHLATSTPELPADDDETSAD